MRGNEGKPNELGNDRGNEGKPNEGNDRRMRGNRMRGMRVEWGEFVRNRNERWMTVEWEKPNERGMKGNLRNWMNWGMRGE
jgi:hypothetical protein